MEVWNVPVLKFDGEDKVGDIFPSDASVEFKEEIPLLMNFDRHIGYSKLIRKEDGLYANLYFYDPVAQELLEKLTPAVGGGIRMRSADGKITKYFVNSVSVSFDGNADERIKKIGEMLK